MVKKGRFKKGKRIAIVKPFAQLTEKGEFLPNNRFHEKTSRARIMIYCAALKVLKAKGIIAEEKATPAEITTATGVPAGTVGRTVRELATANLLATQDGQYWLPGHALSRVQGELGESA